MNTYSCEKCGKDFQTNSPRKTEYMDPIYGNCWRYEADCPDCGVASREKFIPKPSGKNKKEIPVGANPHCGQRNCCCS